MHDSSARQKTRSEGKSGNDDLDLASLEERLRLRLPPSILDEKEVRLSDIIDEAALDRQNPRATIARLIAAGLAAPQTDSTSRVGRARFYARHDALNLLLACELINQHHRSPKAAATVVQRYRREQGLFAGTHLLDTLLNVALERFERHVLGRLVGALLSTLLGRDELPPGTIVFIEPGASASLAAGKKPSDWAADFARRRLRGSGTGRIGIVSESHEIVFVDALAEAVLSGRYFEPIPVPHTNPKYLVIVAGFVDASEAGEKRRNSNLPPRLSDDTYTLAERLLDAVAVGFNELRAQARRVLPPDLVMSPAVMPELGQNQFLLWLLARFACLLARPISPEKAHCMFVMPRPEGRSGKPVLRIVASSDHEPWSSDEASRVILRPGQLLSGYASLTNMTLAVPRTDPPLDMLVSFFTYEQDQGTGGVLTSVAIPISIRDGKSSPVLYMWMPPAEVDIAPVVKILQVLAPVIGEVIQRNLDTAHTIRSCAEAAAARFLSQGELRRAIRDRIERLVAESGGWHRPRGVDERLAFIVLDAAPAESDFAPEATEWLVSQFENLVPRSFLAPWIQDSSYDGRLGSAVFGAIQGNAALLMIPRTLQKDELDRLRAAIPTRVNSLHSAFTEADETMTRVEAWVVDTKWDEVLALEGTKIDDIVDQILNKAEAAASVLADNISSYRNGFLKGDGTQALDSAKNGLAKDEHNPYLLRRAAEFSTYVGDFVGAEDFARRALDLDDGLMNAFCLLGDSLLGQGRVQDAVEAYESARKLDPGHPLPDYAEGFALLTIARLLRIASDEYARNTVLQSSAMDLRTHEEAKSRLNNINFHCDDLCARAANVLRRANESLKNWGTPGLYELRNFLSAPSAYALCQTEFIKGNPTGAVQALIAAKSQHPRDELMDRDLLLAHMWQSGAGRRLAEEYGRLPVRKAPKD
jgi:tetratricopeptide (TPR) repeat protein